MTFPIVTETPLRLEPTTRDTFLDDAGPTPPQRPAPTQSPRGPVDR